MKRSTKKGFTIVELVIVIAIIAILAAVLIPTFASLIQKANESKDTQLVKNLNTALAADNKEHKTMTDALDAAVEFGYDVGKINASATNKEILWDSKNDVFCYYDTNTKTPEYIPETSLKNGAIGEGETYKLWKIYTEAPTEQTFSIYWNSDKAFDKELTVGFDAGSNTAITALTYKGTAGNSVIIRTNSYDTVLTIDAVKDSVKHFDKVGSVVITAVAPKSYHEFGDVQGNISLANGRVVMESGSKASAVKVTATADDVSKGNATVAVDNTAAPTVAVVVPADVKTALEKAGGDNKLNASNDSVITDETTIANMDKFAGGLGTEDSPYLLSTNEHFKNIMQGTADNKLYYKLIADVEASKNFTAEGGNHVIFKLTHSELDGANHTVTITDKSHLFYYVQSSEIKDLKAFVENNMAFYAAATTFNNVDLFGKINTTGGNEGIYVIYATPMANEATLTYIDCDCTVDFTSDGTEGSYNSVFTGYAYANITTLNYTNCTYSGTFISGKAAMFLGNNSANRSNVTINVNNCENKGIIQATLSDKGYYWNSYVATGIKNDLDNDSFKANSVTLNGVKLTADNIAEPMGTGFVQGPNDANLKLVLNADGTFTVTASENTNVAYYEVSVGLYSIWNEGGTLVQNVKEKLDKSSFNNRTKTTTLKKLAFVDKAWVDANSSATAKTYGEGDYKYTVYTLNGTEYYYLPDFTNANLGGEAKDAQIISVSCFDANGNLIASATLSK